MAACKIVVIGRTGDGKSLLCRNLALRLDVNSEAIANALFVDSSAVSSHTHAPVAITGGNPSCLVMDTPGLMDTDGVSKDEENIVSIFQRVADLKSVNGFCLVINEEAPRFDSGMQDAVKLLYDSFGPGCLKNMGIVFTKASGMVTPAALAKKTLELADIISRRTGVDCTESNSFPSWQVDLNPEKLRERPFVTISDDGMKTLMTNRDSTLREIIRWSRAKPEVSTDGSKPGEYKDRKLAREAETKRKEAEDAKVKAEDETKVAVEEKKKAEEVAKNAEDDRMEALEEGESAKKATKWQ